MDTVAAGALFVGFGFLLTFWLMLPLGAVSGWVREQAVATEQDGRGLSGPASGTP